jgi:GNAT superfamily N-acetyltransferase
MPDASFQIAPARSAADLAAVAQLFGSYAAFLGIDLGFQDFATEVDGLPGKYAPPAGVLLLARGVHGEALGCVGLRPILPAGCCEMKRLYVAPGGRGRGLGRALAEAVIAEAERIGYREMRLDTLPTLTEAIALYQRLGFAPIAPYYDTPLAGTVFLARALGV